MCVCLCVCLFACFFVFLCVCLCLFVRLCLFACWSFPGSCRSPGEDFGVQYPNSRSEIKENGLQRGKNWNIGICLFMIFVQGAVLGGRTPPSPTQDGPFPLYSACSRRIFRTNLMGKLDFLTSPPPPQYCFLLIFLFKTPTKEPDNQPNANCLCSGLLLS